MCGEECHIVSDRSLDLEFRRQLDYKARLYGASVVVADRWFPSSKTCSCCGSVKAELDLSQRVFRWGLADSWRIGTATRRKILNDRPQALRCQPVERHALARFARAA
jgi:Putative transposase DNA-binding domain